MAGIISTANFSAALQPIVNKWVGDDLKDLAPIYTKIFDVRQSDKHFEEFGVLSGFGLARVREQGAPFTIDTSNQMHLPRFQHAEYALGFHITKIMIEDGMAMGQSKRFVKMLTKAMAKTPDIVCANILNNAFDSAYTMKGGDGKQLIATDHPSSTGNQSNYLSTGAADISELALEQIHIDIRKATDDRGLRIALLPQKIIVPPELVHEVDRFLSSPDRPNTADRAINSINNMNVFPGGVVVNPYLIDTDAWFVTTDRDEGLVYMERQALRVDTQNDFATDNVLVKGTQRFSAGWIDFRGIFGSAGA